MGQYGANRIVRKHRLKESINRFSAEEIYDVDEVGFLSKVLPQKA